MAGAYDLASGALSPGSPAYSRALERAKTLMVGRTASAFREQGRGGIPWAGRAVPNIPGVLADLAKGPTIKEDRWRERPAGKDTGRLLASIAGEITGDAVIFGSRMEYASRYQRGEAGPPIIITKTMRDNLILWMKKQRRTTRRAAMRGMAGSESRADRLGWLLAATANKSGKSYTYKTQAIRWKPRARPFVVLTDQDRADVSKILAAEVQRDIRGRG